MTEAELEVFRRACESLTRCATRDSGPTVLANQREHPQQTAAKRHPVNTSEQMRETLSMLKAQVEYFRQNQGLGS